SRSFSSTSANNGMSKAQYAEMRSNPEAFRAYWDKRAAYHMKWHEDATWREHMRRYKRNYNKSMDIGPAYRLRALTRHLLISYPWSRAGLPWKLYRPVVTSQPVEHHCSGCGITKRTGMKLWWHRTLAGSDIFLCHGCLFSKGEWARAMPEGYEDVKTIKGFVARKKQL
ncbi:uncharacterized protein M437DRAFT_26439, partial [Aureobasidium melanogenum CBS 110374]